MPSSRSHRRGADWRPDLAELRAIHRASRAVVKETPVFSFGELSRRCGGEVLLKAENLQRTGSFKLRGTSAKLAAAGRPAAVVAGSAGNHGQALAYAARAEGIPCTVFMPVDAATAKVDAVAGFGATVRLEGGSVDECVELAERFAVDSGALFVHPFDDLEIVRGQAGVGVELLKQAPEMGRVIVPIGGGGLVSGIAAVVKAARPESEVIGVQASGCPALRRSLDAGEPVAVTAPSTIADGIAVKRPGDLTYPLIERWVDEVVEVDDAQIAAAMVLLAERAKLVTEGAGAVAVAALAAGIVAPARSGSTVAMLSGGNVDPSVLAGVLSRAQTGTGRRLRLFTRIADRPGALAGLLEQVGTAGGNVLDVTHVRDGVELGVRETGVEIVLECRNHLAARDLLAELRRCSYVVQQLGAAGELVPETNRIQNR